MAPHWLYTPPCCQLKLPSKVTPLCAGLARGWNRTSGHVGEADTMTHQRPALVCRAGDWNGNIHRAMARGARMAESCQKEETAEGWSGAGPVGWSTVGQAQEPISQGNCSFLCSSSGLSSPNPLSTLQVSHAVFAGLLCPWLAVSGASQQTWDSSEGSVMAVEVAGSQEILM